MNILISQLSQTPIYEQLENQLRQAILDGSLKPGDSVPSIRGMAKDLGVGVITVKRAYDDLCQEGFLISLQGRGVFVSELDTDSEHAKRLEQLRNKLTEVKTFCDTSAITKEELVGEIDKLYK